MEIIRLPLGVQASVDADCIRIEEQPGATYKLTASALCVGADDGESVSVVGGPVFGPSSRPKRPASLGLRTSVLSACSSAQAH
jgi:hypothetical protein